MLVTVITSVVCGVWHAALIAERYVMSVVFTFNIFVFPALSPSKVITSSSPFRDASAGVL